MIIYLSIIFIRSIKVECDDDRGNDLLKHLFSTDKDNKSIRELLEGKDWRDYTYKIKLNISGTSDKPTTPRPRPRLTSQVSSNTTSIMSETFDSFIATGYFSFLHMVILAKNIQILKYLLKHDKDVPSEYKKKIKW